MGSRVIKPSRVDTASLVSQFFACESFAVVGASSNSEKFGNKVLKKYVQHGLRVVPVHPSEKEIEGLEVKQLAEIAGEAEQVSKVGLSVITPPQVTERVLKEATDLGFQHIWLQPGAESAAVINAATELNLQVIHGGPCVLVSLDKGEQLGKL